MERRLLLPQASRQRLAPLIQAHSLPELASLTLSAARAQQTSRQARRVAESPLATATLAAAGVLAWRRRARTEFRPSCLAIGLNPVTEPSDAPSPGDAGSASGETGEKTVWFVRHGQAEHNVLYESGDSEGCKALLDPLLTPLGENQALQVAEDPFLKPHLGEADSVQLVVCSPLRRTVQTAIGSMQSWLSAAPGRQIVLHPDLQETGEVNCDCGLPLEQVRAFFSEQDDALDFTEMHEGWHEKRWPYNDDGKALRTRLERFSTWLWKRPESRIVVVTHHNLLVALLRVSFLNCEVRRYAFRRSGPDSVEDGSQGGAPLIWAPSLPLVSAEDAELSQADVRHLKVYDPMVRRKFKSWGFEPPDRLR